MPWQCRWLVELDGAAALRPEVGFADTPVPVL
jgi:hypothetical protein